ncbi:MAG TPA: Stp1/IreP family PP2C-type Ser/Thr phosphatase [Mycobacteriales bacterium]
MTLSLRYGVRSHVGHVREGNEDSGYASPRLVAVADGMGGAVAGEVASRTVVDRLAHVDADSLGPDVVGSLQRAVLTANDDLHAAVRRDESLAGMGTTITVLLVDDDRIALVHVGDSRCYLYRGGELTQVTKDHTLVQELVDAGQITEDEASVHPKRNIITRVLDGRDNLELDVSVRTAQVGDRYLLCSDGLSSYVSLETITDAVALPEPQAAADRMVELALRAGGPDNVTVLVADVVDSGDPGIEPTLAGAAADEHDEEPDPAVTSAGRAAALRHPVRGLALRRSRDDPPASARRSRWLVPGVGLAIVVVVGLGVLGGWLYIRSQWYVGPDGGNVALYRGIPGSVGPIHLSSVVETGPPLDSLQPETQRQVNQKITAGSRQSAERILQEIETGTLPTGGGTTVPNTGGTSPTSTALTTSATAPTGPAS